jgi:hypothetical protein
MITRAYSRCNSGHYFTGIHCPLDGWSSQASVELDEACRRLEAAGHAISLATLREAGVSPCSLERIIVIQFGSDESAFEAVAPEGYVVGGKWSLVEDLAEAFM